MLPGEEYWILVVSASDSPATLCRSQHHPKQHLILLPDAEDGDLNAPSIATSAAAKLCPHPYAVDPKVTADANASLENRWCQIKDTVQSTALTVLCRSRRQHQDWFDENDVVISNLLAEKNRLHKAFVNCLTDVNEAAFCRSRRPVQQWLREIQETRAARKAEEIHGLASRNEYMNFFAAIKIVYGTTTKVTTPLLSVNGTALFTEKAQIPKYWADYFRSFLSRRSTIFEIAID
ncbi:hypothetical protein SprV_0301248000 [Sparganum proliferum]